MQPFGVRLGIMGENKKKEKHKMKKILSILLIFVMLFALASCGNKADEKTNAKNPQTEEEIIVGNEETQEEEILEEESEENPEETPETKPETKPEVKPEEKPQAKPEVKPEQKPEEKPASSSGSVASVLLSEFKKIASSDTQTIAQKLVENPVIKFSGGVVPVSEGFLNGFDNAEIKGFKEGAMFAPMMGTIPFVGYIFELESADKTADFIATLKSCANLRWNICTSADEMVAGAVGNKVFFVMSPLKFED